MTDDLNNIKERLSKADIHVIPYCHADYAWTHPREWHTARYLKIVDEVLDLMSENNDYTWMMDNIIPLLDAYLSEKPNRTGELVERIREGRIEMTNGTLVLLRPTMAGDETFIRNIIIGREYMRGLIPDFATRVFHNVDVSIGHSQLPQILRLGGYDFYRAWRPQGAMDAKGIPRQFIWEGPDGSGISCSRGTYAGLWRTGYMTGDCNSGGDLILEKFYENEIRDILANSLSESIWLPFGMDDTRPMRDFNDNPVNLDGFMDYLRETTGVSINYSTAERYFNRLSNTNLPVYRGIPDPCDVGYNIPSKGDKGLWLARILLDTLAVRTETLWTMAALAGGAYPEDDLKKLWETTVFICSHGMEFVFAHDYDDIIQRVVSAMTVAKHLSDDAIQVLAGSVTKKSVTKKDDVRFVLANTLNWERREIFFIPTHDAGLSGSFLVSGSDGKAIESQPVFAIPAAGGENSRRLLGFLVEAGIRSLGFSTISVSNPPSKDQPQPYDDFNINPPGLQEIDTGEIKVVFQNGRIITINGRDFLAEDGVSAGSIRFSEMEQTPTDAWLYNNRPGIVHEFRPSHWYWEEEGPLRWKYVLIGVSGPHTVRQEITLYRGRTDIDFSTVVECAPRTRGFFLASFPADEKTEFTADIPFGVEKRIIHQEPFGVSTDIDIDNLERLWKGVFYSKSWINYQYEANSVTLTGVSSPRYYLHDSGRKSVSIILTRIYDLDKCTDWMKYAHPYHEEPGEIKFTYSLNITGEISGPCYLPMIKESLEKKNPIEPYMLPRNSSGALPMKTMTFLDIMSESTVISTLYMHKGRTILRLYNASDKNDCLEIVSARRILSFALTDFHLNPVERPDTVIDACGLSLKTEAGPWEILTLVLEFET
ncbi:MAG: glycoside hydrolase family 38 C-terminal domain-containing protein [Clostridia bacterium]